MKSEQKKTMRQDCCKFMRGSIFASFFYRLISIAAPTVTAWMIGDMADHLLALDQKAVLAGLLPFLCAIAFQVVVAPLTGLAINLGLTKQGFAYDGFLMRKFLRLPLLTVQTTDAGVVMERLEEDSAAFCWNQMILHSYLGAAILYLIVFLGGMAASGCHVLFVFTILILAALPVVRATWTGKRQTELKKQNSEYQEARKLLEQELYDARDLAKGFGLGGFFVERLRKRFQVFFGETGKAQSRMEAKNETLDFLCGYGVQVGAVTVGVLLVSTGRLTLGALLGGFLMLPAVQSCFGYIKSWVTELHDEKKYLTRLAFFYEPAEELGGEEDLTELSARGMRFVYPGAEPVLDGVSFAMTKGENCRLCGPNGSGKTTLLSLLAGLYQPQGGTVCGGAALGVRRAGVALQEQDGAVFSGTVWDNLFLSESKREEAERLRRELGLDKPLDHEVTAEGGNLSPGERKKVLLLRALLRNVPFLLLDEPLNHLDEQGRTALLRRLKARKGGVLLISHEELEGFALREYQMG